MSFLEKATEDWKSIFRSTVFLSLLFGLFFLFVWALVSHVNPSSVSVSSGNGIAIEFGGSETLSAQLVHPRGWNPTRVRVNEGEEIIIDASGSIHIAMGRMINGLRYQYKVKEENEDTVGRGLEHFTDEQVRNSVFAYPWNGPTGIVKEHLINESAKSRIASLQNSRVDPKARVGQLLMVIGESDTSSPDLSTSQIIPYSSAKERIIASRSGYLWFIINDEKMGDNRLINTLLWQDNLGMFSVKVLVKST